MAIENREPCDLCVPYKKEENKTNKNITKYLLYSVTYKKYDAWTFEFNDIDKEIIEKRFEGYRDYFQKQCNLDKCTGKISFVALNSQSEDDKEIKKLTEDCPSVLLGVFLRSAKIFHRYKFKKKWKIICSTGVIEYKGGELKLLQCEDILDKYKDEFLKIAQNNKNEDYLFLYINDKLKETELIDKSKKQKPDNVTIKRYTTENSIRDIYDDVFEPIEVNHKFEEYNNDQQIFIKHMKKEAELDYGRSYGYITGNHFDNLMKKILHESKWRGFYIYGAKGTGKSATAMAIAEYLSWTNIIVAPIWINFSNPAIEEFINKRLLNIDKIEKYIISIITDLFNSNDKKNNRKLFLNKKSKIWNDILKRISEGNKKYLIVIDNLTMDEDDINQILQIIKKLFSNCLNQLYLIITSRILCVNSYYINILELQKEKVPKLNKIQIATLIKKIAKNEGTKWEIKIDEAEKTNTLNRLLNILSKKFYNSPYMIIEIIKLLKNKTVIELSHEIKYKYNEKIIKEIILDPKSYDDYISCGKVYLNNDQYNMAIKYFNKAVKLKPKINRTYVSLGKTYRKIFLLLKTINKINKLSKYNRVKYNDYLFCGKFHIGLFFYFQAIINFNKAIKLDPEDFTSYLFRGKIYLDSGNYNNAINDFNMAVRLKPDNSIVYYLRAKAYFYNIYCSVKAIKTSTYDTILKLANKVLEKDVLNDHYPGFIKSSFMNQYITNREFAITDLRNAIKLNPKFYNAYILLGKITQNFNKYMAIKEYDNAINLYPKKLSAYVFRGIVNHYNDKLNEAIEDCNKVIESRENINNKISQGESYMVKGQTEKAIINFYKYINLKKYISKAYEIRGQIFLENRIYKKAMEDLNQALSFYPGKLIANFRLGEACLKDNDYLSAILSLNIAEAIIFDKKIDTLYFIDRIHTYRGKAYLEINQYNEAIKYLTKAIRTDNNTSAFDHAHSRHDYFIDGQIKGKYDKAIKDLNKETRGDYRSKSYAFAWRGDAYRIKGKYDKAIKDLTKAIKNINGTFSLYYTDDTRAYTYSRRGDVYRRTGQYEEAIDDLTKAISFANSKFHLNAYYDSSKDLYAYYSWRGDAYRLKGQYEEAIKDLTKSIELNPEYNKAIEVVKNIPKQYYTDDIRAYIYSRRGDAYRLTGQYEEAIKDLTKAIGFASKDLDVNYNWRGDAYRLTGQYEEAIDDFTKVIRFTNSNSLYLYYSWRGDAYRLTGQYEEAIKDLTKSIELNPNKYFAYIIRSFTYKNLGETSLSLYDIIKAEKLNPPDSWKIKIVEHMKSLS